MQSPTHVHHDADNVCPGGITESRALEGSSSFLRRCMCRSYFFLEFSRNTSIGPIVHLSLLSDNRIRRANDSGYQLHTSPIETTDQNVILETEAAPKAELRTTDQNPIQETASTQTAGLETHGSQHDSGRQTDRSCCCCEGGARAGAGGHGSELDSRWKGAAARGHDEPSVWEF